MGRGHRLQAFKTKMEEHKNSPINKAEEKPQSWTCSK